jgi:hypothetical protein
MKAPLQLDPKTSSITPPTFTPVSRGRLQRKCACGRAPGPTGECEECRKRKLQRRASNSPAPSSTHHPPSSVSEVPPIVHEVLRSPGQPLDAETREFMEPRFGHDFSHVRVHTDTKAAESAYAINAHAYTLGENVVFADGRYQPRSARGRHLLAHELAHTIQQANHKRVAPHHISVGRADDISERHADAKADSVVSPLSVGPDLLTLPEYRSLQPILRRQLCNKADDKIVTGPLNPQLPDIKCEPTPKTSTEIKSIPGVVQGVLGVTLPVITGIEASHHSMAGGMCKTTVTPWTMKLDPFLYTKAGMYDDGKESVTSGDCKGKTISKKLRITEAMEQKIKEGEIEHCNDNKLAFSLSLGEYNEAAKDIAGRDYCAEKTPCQDEFLKRFQDRTGVAWGRQGPIGGCLLSKSQLRDAKGWHTSNSYPDYAVDCSMVTYTSDPKRMKDIGKHPSSEVVTATDCEK